MEIEIVVKHEPIEDCCELGCGSHPVGYLSQCVDCGKRERQYVAARIDIPPALGLDD